jgi:hypothetical protein
MHGGCLSVVEQQRQQRSKLRWQKVFLRPRQFLKEPTACFLHKRNTDFLVVFGFEILYIDTTTP